MSQEETVRVLEREIERLTLELETMRERACTVCQEKPEAREVFRRFELIIAIGADNWEDAVHVLRDFADSIEERGAAHCGRILAGPSSGGWIKCWDRPEQTHEKWEQDLAKYLEKRP